MTCTSVLAQRVLTPWIFSEIICSSALPPPPPTPTILIIALCFVSFFSDMPFLLQRFLSTNLACVSKDLGYCCSSRIHRADVVDFLLIVNLRSSHRWDY